MGHTAAQCRRLFRDGKRRINNKRPCYAHQIWESANDQIVLFEVPPLKKGEHRAACKVRLPKSEQKVEIWQCSIAWPSCASPISAAGKCWSFWRAKEQVVEGVEILVASSPPVQGKQQISPLADTISSLAPLMILAGTRTGAENPSVWTVTHYPQNRPLPRVRTRRRKKWNCDWRREWENREYREIKRAVGYKTGQKSKPLEVSGPSS